MIGACVWYVPSGASRESVVKGTLVHKTFASSLANGTKATLFNQNTSCAFYGLPVTPIAVINNFVFALEDLLREKLIRSPCIDVGVTCVRDSEQDCEQGSGDRSDLNILQGRFSPNRGRSDLSRLVHIMTR